MSPFIRSLMFAVSFTLFLQPAFAAEPRDGVGEGVLVLHNGQVLRGGITRVGDKFIVTLGEKGELRIPVGNVEMHCRDLGEVYLQKRLTLKRTDVAGHLDLTEWCLRHSLLSQAADELLAAIAVQPDHPRIRTIERRLQLAISRPIQTLRSERLKGPSVSLDELERTMRELPEDVVQTFTAHVQPLLVNRCASNACHGSGSDAEFRLVRPSWGKTLTRRFTQRNLHASIMQIDKESPEKSPLLTAPSAPHGTVASALFEDRDRHQFELLANWVQQVVHKKDSPPPTIAPGPSSLLQASYAEPVKLPSTENSPAASDHLSGSRTPPATPARLITGQPDGYVPRDFFDPEIFNRRYLRPGHRD